MTKYFANCANLDDLKKQYRRLAMQYHPDCGGSTEAMQEINAEHDRLFEALKAQHNASADEYHQTTETAAEFRDIIEALLKMNGLTVELAGCWVWIGGETRKWKEQLKAAGCRWSSNKKLWYWRHPEDGRKWHKGNKTMTEIRAKYGSQIFNGSKESSNYATIGSAV